MTSPLPAQPGHDWPSEVADRIDSVVGAVRDKTTVPALEVARAVVYGAVVVVLATCIVVLLVIALLRLLYVYLPIQPLARRVWVADAIVSAIFLGGGALVWRRRRPLSA